MRQRVAVKVSVLVAAALLVAVVPVTVRLSERDSGQRIETDSTPTDDDLAAGDDASIEALPLVADSDPLLEQTDGADQRPKLLDLASGAAPASSVPAGDAAAETAEAPDAAPAEDEASDADPADAETAEASDAAPAEAEASDADPEEGSSSTTVQATTTTTAPTTTTAAPATTTRVGSTTPGTAPGSDQRALYVDASRGSGSNPGTEDRPFRRPVEALTIAEPGTTIYIRAGTYDTSVHSGFSIRRSGTPDRWIRITPYPGERVELTAGGEYGSGFEVLGASYVEVSGFVLRGRNDSIHGSGVFVKDGAHDVRIIGNHISNFGGAGISVIGSSRVTIEGNEVRDNAFRSHYQGSGISLYKMSGPTNSGFSNVVRGNYVFNNRNEVRHRDGRLTDGNCIIMDRNNESGYQGWTLIENNVCAENGGRGVHSYRSSYIEARNNTLYHNMASSAITHGRGEMTVGTARDVYFYNNLVINRPGVASYIDNDTTNTRFINNHVASGPPAGEGNQLLPSGVALFSSTNRGGPVNQFRPLGPAGLAGTADGTRQASNDFTGSRRPTNGAVGAFEP